jgi:hypothetical protein
MQGGVCPGRIEHAQFQAVPASALLEFSGLRSTAELQIFKSDRSLRWPFEIIWRCRSFNQEATLSLEPGE